MRILTTSLALVVLVGCDNGPAVNNNEAPIAVIGDDIDQPANIRVFLDGRSSFDADGDTLEFHWTLDHAPQNSSLSAKVGPLSPNHSADAATTSFQPDVTGVYVVAMRAYDGQTYSDPAYVVVNAQEPTECPVAEAGNEQVLASGTTAYLDGGQSVDPQGGTLNFNWSLTEKPYNSRLGVDSIVNAEQRQAEFTGDVPGKYKVALVVSNGMCTSPPNTTDLTFTGDNSAPVANASGNFTTEDCITVPLTCAASTDADNDRLFYWWTMQASPSNSKVDNRSFTNQNAATPDVFFDVAGEYQLTCSVFDGKVWSAPDTITVTVEERSYNDIPVVDVGPDIVVDYGITECEQSRVNPWSPLVTQCDKVTPDDDVTVVAKVSDPDGDKFTLYWETIRESKARIVGRTGELTVDVKPPSFQPSEIGITEDLSYVQLGATDCTLETGKDDFELLTTVEGVLN